MKRMKKKLSLLMMDCDNLKEINDTYGHPAGDSVLAEVAGKFRENLRREDILIRYGGEEFVVILPGMSIEKASGTAQRLRNMIGEYPFYWEGEGFNITISIGVASFPKDTGEYRRLLNIADKRLLKAKNMGKNRIVNK